MKVLKKILNNATAKPKYKTLSTGVVTKIVGNTVTVIQDGHRSY
jgi:hypothetical protein